MAGGGGTQFGAIRGGEWMLYVGRGDGGEIKLWKERMPDIPAEVHPDGSMTLHFPDPTIDRIPVKPLYEHEDPEVYRAEATALLESFER